MGAATTEIGRQFLADLRFAGVRDAVEQGLGGHDHAVQAVAALGRLLVNKGLLHRVRRFAAAEAFEGDDLPVHGAGQGKHTGARGHAVDDHRAGSALPQATAVFGAVEPQVVAQHQQQRGIGHGRHRMALAVDLKGYRDFLRRHGLRSLHLMK